MCDKYTLTNGQNQGYNKEDALLKIGSDLLSFSVHDKSGVHSLQHIITSAKCFIIANGHIKNVKGWQNSQLAMHQNSHEQMSYKANVQCYKNIYIP